jgi:uncharacterized protein YbcC (UPF0753/DUF2309 family)
LVKAWEKLAKELVKVLDSKQISTSTTEKKERVQMLKWCFIDTDQELIRRHVEKGHYETLDMQVFWNDGL